MIGLAAWFVADAEYPVAADPPQTSAEPLVVLLPEPLNPLGEVSHEGLRFQWLWAGPEVLWEIVLLDAGMEELLRVRDIRGTSLVPQGELRELLRRGGRFHWFIAYATEGRTFNSLPVPLILPERLPQPR